MKNWTLELENGLVLNVRNIDEEIYVTYEDVGSIELLTLTNVDLLVLVNKTLELNKGRKYEKRV